MKFLLLFFIFYFQVLSADIGTCASPVTVSNSSITPANLNGGEEAHYTFSVPGAGRIKVYTTGYDGSNDLNGELFNTAGCTSLKDSDSGSDANVEMTYIATGSTTIQIKLVSAFIGEGASGSFDFHVEYTALIPAETPPDLSGTISSQYVRTSTYYSKSIVYLFSETDGDTITYSLVGSWPPGISLDSATGLISGTAPATAGTYGSLQIKATDNDGSTKSNLFTFYIQDSVPPAFGSTYGNSILDMNLTKDNYYNAIYFKKYFTIQPGSIVTYSMSTIPSGMTFNTNARLYGTPDTVATYSTSITVTDSNTGDTATSNTFLIHVIDPHLTSSTIPDFTAAEGIPFSEDLKSYFNATAMYGVTYSLAGSLPAGISLDSNTSILHGTPSTPGVYSNINVTATKGFSSVTSNNFTITVLPKPLVQLSNIPTLTVINGQNYLYDTAQHFSSASAIKFTTSSTLPTGLSLAQDGKISGVATQTGTYTLMYVTATDDTNATLTSNAFTIDVVDKIRYTNARDFTMRHQYNVFGDVSVLGNTVLCLIDSGTGKCIESNINVSNDKVNLERAPTSSATLTLPYQAVVEYARIYWQGRKKMNETWDTSSKNLAEKIKLKKGTGSYIELTADVQDFAMYNTTPIYSSSADALSIVDAAATYQVDTASFYTHTGKTYDESPRDTLGASGSWVLVVIYSDPNEADAKNITIFDGYKQVSTNNPASASISGFLTPHNRSVDANIYVYAAEGDKYLGGTGDQIEMSGEVYNTTLKVLGTFDSRIDLNATRVPKLDNNNGTDIHKYDVGASGEDIITNDETGAKFKFTSDADVYFPSLFVLSVDLFLPKLCYDYAIKQDGHYLDIDRSLSNPEAYIDSKISSSDLEVTVYLKNIESDVPAEGISLTSDVNTSKFDQVGHMYSSFIRTNKLVDRGGPLGTCNPASSYDIYGDNETTNTGCTDGHNIRKGIGSLNHQDYIYAKFKLHPTTSSGRIDEPLGLALNYYITSAGTKVPYPSNTLGSRNILLCEPTTTYTPMYGSFNVIDSAAAISKENNLKTQISRKAFKNAVVFDSSISTGTNDAPSSDLNTTLLVEIIDVGSFGDINASCSNPDAAVSKAIFVPISFTSSNYTTNIAAQTDDYFNFATKNAAFRIWYFADQNGTLSQNWTATTTGTTNRISTLTSISGLYDSTIYSECNASCSTTTSTACFTCLRDTYAQALCSRDNFSIRPESYDVHIYDVNNSLASNDALKDSTKFDISTQLNYSPAANSAATTRMDLAAGYTYRIDINATGHDGLAPVPGYTRTFMDSSDYNASYIWNPQKLTLQCNDINSSYLNFYIANGEMYNLENTLTQVGEYILNITDKTWTAVDWRDTSHHDTSATGGFAATADCVQYSSLTDTNLTHGCNITTNHGSNNGSRYYQDHNITFHPYKFLMTSIVPSVGLDHTPLTSSTTPQYVYMSDIFRSSYQDQNMSFHLNGKITAAGFNDVPLSNYTGNCFANNLDLDILKDTNSTLLGKNGKPIHYRINFHNRDVNNTIIVADTLSKVSTYTGSTDIYGNITYTSHNPILSITASYFTDALNGSIDTIANLNYDRNVSNPANPKIIAHKQYNVGCTTAADCTFYADLKTNATSEGTFSIDTNDTNATLNSDIVYYYGRTNALRQRFVGPSGDVFIYYEVYCAGADCNKTLLQDSTLSTYTNDPRWFKNTQHDIASYGNEGSISQKNATNVNSGVTSSVLGKTTVPVTYNAAKGYPYKATMQNSASPWLIYNPYDETRTNNEFEVEFTNINSTWAGKDNAGSNTNRNGANKTNRRSMW